MIRNPDMVVGMIKGKELIAPGFYKTFLLGNTESKIVRHDCLYEGREMFQKLKNHVILGQITVDKNFTKDNNIDSKFEFTPIVNNVSPLFPHYPLSGNDKLWRYIDIKKFESLIQHRSLYFARIDQFSDNLEGVSSFQSVKSIMSAKSKSDLQKQESLRLYHKRIENNRKVSFACCWHINKDVNLEMWNQYGGSADSIAIETNVSKLNRELEKSGMPFLNEPVRYFNEDYFNQYAYWFPTMFKRELFKHEREYRSILFVHGFELTGLHIKINVENFIRRIHVHPEATIRYLKEIKHLIKNSGLKIPVVKANKTVG